MKIIDDYVFEFESTGRKLHTGMDGISISEEGDVMYGHDGYAEIGGDDGEPDFDIEFMEEEKKELAELMIKIWAVWGGVSLNFKN